MLIYKVLSLSVILDILLTIRYHYYLQLKNDILEDRIHCHPQQAIVLVSYSMQAEFGNYDAERHRPEFLQQDTFFPKVKKHIVSPT